MANLTGTKQIFHSDTDDVDTTQVEILGTRAWDTSGNEYIYLQGVGSTVAGDWVVYDENFATTRLTANEVGPVAIAMAAVDATTEYGWYQIWGKNTVARTDTVAADKALYIDGTAGRADDSGVTGDIIIGAYSMTADTSNVTTVWITYPHVTDDLGGATGGLSLLAATGTINDTNLDFTFTSEPTLLVINGAVYRTTGGAITWTWSDPTATLSVAVGTGGSIFGID